jgi:hypothetical protein
MGEGKLNVDVAAVKKEAKQLSAQIKNDQDFDRVEAELFKKYSSAVKSAVTPAAAAKPPAASPAPAPPPPADQAKPQEAPHAAS